MNCIQIDDRKWFYRVGYGCVRFDAPDGCVIVREIAQVVDVPSLLRRGAERLHYGSVTPQHIRNYVTTQLAIHDRENQKGEIFADGTHNAER